MYYKITGNTINSGPHSLQSDAVKAIARTGNAELLSAAELLALGLVPEVRATLGYGQTHGAPVLAGDGKSVTLAAVNRPLVDVKTEAIQAINATCTARLIERFGPPEKQASVSSGLYGAAEKTAWTVGVKSTVDASNDAQNAILAATTVAQVGSVAATWPVI